MIVIWSLAALGQIGAWGTCGTYWWGDYLGSWGNVCAKSSAVLAFDVFLFLAWLASLTVALLEKFAPKYVGSPIGWKNAKADEGVKVAMAPVEQV